MRIKVNSERTLLASTFLALALTGYLGDCAFSQTLASSNSNTNTKANSETESKLTETESKPTKKSEPTSTSEATSESTSMSASDSKAKSTSKESTRVVTPPTREDIDKSVDRGLFIESVRTKSKAPQVVPKSKKTVPLPKASTSANLSKNPTKQKPEKAVAKSPAPTQKSSSKSKREPVQKTAAMSGSRETTHDAKAVPVSHKLVKPLKASGFLEGEQIVTAWLNKNGKSPHYRSGEKLKVTVSANRDCNVLIFNYDGGVLTQIFPNQYQPDPFVARGQTVIIGGSDSRFDFEAKNDSKAASAEKIFVYAYPNGDVAKSPISVAMSQLPSSPFRSTEFSPEEYRKLVNESKIFFSRKVEVVPKKTSKVDFQHIDAAPNKVELSLVIDGRK